jgi:hypothetical protein
LEKPVTPFIILLVLLAAAIMLYAVMVGGGKKGQRRRSSSRSYTGHIDSSELRIRWQTVLATSQTGASGLKSAINEADKLLDYAMRQKGYPGETMGERLKSAGRDLTNRDATWRAHKLRNALAHEVAFDLVPSQAKEALADFERALRDLGAL